MDSFQNKSIDGVKLSVNFIDHLLEKEYTWIFFPQFTLFVWMEEEIGM